VEDVRDKHSALLDEWPMGVARNRRLVELNTIEQTVNVCHTTILKDAWARGQEITVHGWTYGVHDGRVRNMGMMISDAEQVEPAYQRCIAALARGGAHSSENDVLAADAARLGDVPAIVEGVIKELKHD
jgi:carbonic anhydrase